MIENVRELLEDNNVGGIDPILSIWKSFQSYCDLMGVDSLPADKGVVINYLKIKSKSHTATSLDKISASINKVHKIADYESPGGLKSLLPKFKHKTPMLMKERHIDFIARIKKIPIKYRLMASLMFDAMLSKNDPCDIEWQDFFMDFDGSPYLRVYRLRGKSFKRPKDFLLSGRSERLITKYREYNAFLANAKPTDKVFGGTGKLVRVAFDSISNISGWKFTPNSPRIGARVRKRKLEQGKRRNAK